MHLSVSIQIISKNILLAKNFKAQLQHIGDIFRHQPKYFYLIDQEVDDFYGSSIKCQLYLGFEVKLNLQKFVKRQQKVINRSFPRGSAKFGRQMSGRAIINIFQSEVLFMSLFCSWLIQLAYMVFKLSVFDLNIKCFGAYVKSTL